MSKNIGRLPVPEVNEQNERDGSDAPPPGCALATFAGGCFWCLESVFAVLKGVKETVSGYTGGWVEAPTYEQVCQGETGHVEALRVVFDPRQVSYSDLLAIFWRNIDPTRDDGQFCDTGPQYRPLIFVHNAQQREEAEASRCHIETVLAAAIKVDIVDAGPFYPAEDAHQGYYRKNPLRYRLYHEGCGRKAKLHQIWARLQNRPTGKQTGGKQTGGNEPVGSRAMGTKSCLDVAGGGGLGKCGRFGGCSSVG